MSAFDNGLAKGCVKEYELFEPKYCQIGQPEKMSKRRRDDYLIQPCCFEELMYKTASKKE